MPKKLTKNKKPKNSKKTQNTKFNKKCSSECVKKSSKLKDKKDIVAFMKICIMLCSIESSYLLSENKIREIMKNVPKNKIADVKKLFDFIKVSRPVFELHLDTMYQKLKKHYIPIIYKLKDDDTLFAN